MATEKRTKDKPATAPKQQRGQRWANSAADISHLRAYKRQALIREASYAFGRYGYVDTSLEDIAKKLNLSKAALYYYVKSKDELLYECYMLALDLGDQALGRAVSEGKSGLDKIKIFMGSYIELLTTELDAAAILLDYTYLNADMRAKIQQRRKDHDRILRDMILDGIRDGSCGECDPKLAVFWFMGAINSISRWYDADGSLEGAAIAEAYIHFAVNGFGRHGAPAHMVKPGRTAARTK